MTPLFEHYERIASLNSNDKEPTYLVSVKEVENDYGHEYNSFPELTLFRAKFGGEFGLYCVAEVDGKLVDAKIPLSSIQNLVFVYPLDLIALRNHGF